MENGTRDFQRRVHIYEQLMDCMPDAAAALDCEGVFLFVNRSACELSGYSAAELIGSSFSQLLTPLDRDPVAAQVFRTLRTGIPVKGFKTRIRRKDGDTRVISFTLDPLTESGQIVGAIGTAEDVTSREHADRQYRLLESIVLNAREGIVITEA